MINPVCCHARHAESYRLAPRLLQPAGGQHVRLCLSQRTEPVAFVFEGAPRMLSCPTLPGIVPCDSDQTRPYKCWENPLDAAHGRLDDRRNQIIVGAQPGG